MDVKCKLQVPSSPLVCCVVTVRLASVCSFYMQNLLLEFSATWGQSNHKTHLTYYHL